MNKEIWVATSNKKKVKEFEYFFKNHNITVKSLLDLPEKIQDIKENGSTYIENANIKALMLSKLIGKPVIADDSGLEIIKLNGFPGIKTKRWADPIFDDSVKNKMLLKRCEEINNYDAKAVCVISYADPLRRVIKPFTGEVFGTLKNNDKEYTDAFGFDPIFFLEKHNKFFADFSTAEKNKYSHRAKAINSFLEWYIAL